MDVLDEIKDLQQQKQVQKQSKRKLTYDEYNNLIVNRIKRINAELFMLFHELAQDKPQKKVDEINTVLRDFQLNQVQELHEQLKTTFY